MKSASGSSSSSSVLASLYDILPLLPRRETRDAVARRLPVVGDGRWTSGSWWCLVDRREGAARFRLFVSSSVSEELPEISSSLLGSLYETGPRLRFDVTAIVAQ
jgi:hypothetical protein